MRVECHLVKGSHPVTITWFRNGSHYPTRRNAFIIILTHPSNGDVFSCRAKNSIGNDTSGNTTIHVEYGKCICMLYTVYYKSLCLFWSIVCFNNICMCVCVHAALVCYFLPLYTNHTYQLTGTDTSLPHYILIQLRTFIFQVLSSAHSTHNYIHAYWQQYHLHVHARHS